MSEKDNIKLKTATLSSRKSSASAGVHVKRKRKIITKPVSTQEVKAKDAPLEKKENLNLSSQKVNLNEKKNNSSAKASEPPTQDIKSPKNKKMIKNKKKEKLKKKK